MKISYRTHPVLEKLTNEKLGRIGVEEDKGQLFQKYLDLAKRVWYVTSKMFKENIRVYSDKYCEAFLDNREKIIKEAVNFIDEEILTKKGHGCILMKNGYSICYYFNYTHNTISETDFCFYFFHRDVLLAFAIDSFDGIDPIDKDRNVKYWYFPNDKEVDNYNSLLLHFLAFAKYCQVEEKIMQPLSKIKDIACKYINDTDLKITHIDSHWFTNLHVSGAFKVRGHLRLQPYKKVGEWSKKWIWINEFEKHGYTAPARKLKEYPA